MAQQKALFLLTPNNGEWRVDTRDIPKPGPGEVLVKLRATALNPIDWKIRAWNLGGRNYPAILGSDASGTVDAVGEEVQDVAKGDRVVHQGFATNDKSTFQQYTITPADIVGKLPTNVSFDEAASIPVGLSTAAIGLYGEKPAGVKKYKPSWEDEGKGLYDGHPIIIFGGSGSVGQYVIQLAKLSGFSPIIATASSRNADLLKSLGATHFVDRKSADVPGQIKEILQGYQVKIIYDAVSVKETQTQAWDLLAPGGQLIILLGPEVDKDKDKGRAVVSVVGNVHLSQNRALGVSLYSKLTKLLEEGSIKTNRVEVLPSGLAGIPDGLERLRKGEVSGKKLVARPQETP